VVRQNCPEAQFGRRLRHLFGPVDLHTPSGFLHVVQGHACIASNAAQKVTASGIISLLIDLSHAPKDL